MLHVAIFDTNSIMFYTEYISIALSSASDHSSDQRTISWTIRREEGDHLPRYQRTISWTICREEGDHLPS